MFFSTIHNILVNQEKNTRESFLKPGLITKWFENSRRKIKFDFREVFLTAYQSDHQELNKRKHFHIYLTIIL